MCVADAVKRRRVYLVQQHAMMTGRWHRAVQLGLRRVYNNTRYGRVRGLARRPVDSSSVREIEVAGRIYQQQLV